MSDVEKLYAAMTAKWPKPCKPWNELQPGHQMALMQAFNTIIAVMEQA
jgi:hypothetical protein